ncbi:hypothetical protein Ahy_A10g050209 [Arachis hypogaea]|uniref:Aminotransferase-like plant mobile domain-containing protein n=1 Tax=Arachis hypogaea TaxID=3818 RepID=A0A445B8T8_ARAHY|nr:hypothetical protein Ahy_A10g050209 [Arachis hypogaea]
MGAEGTEVTDDEHVAFLFYWLNAILFCSRSVQMSKFFLPLATLLHEGKVLNLAKLLLGHILEELGQFDFDNDQLNFTPFLCHNYGPVWLDRLLFPNTNEESELTNQNWTNLLTVQVIPIGLPQHTKKFKITLYAPYLTARQLGFSQAIPMPQPRHGDPFCHIALTSQEDFNACLLKNQQCRDRSTS